MKRRPLAKLFLYRYRFQIGYIILGIAFLGLIFFLPNISPAGLSEAEMSSTVDSYNLHFSSVTTGDLLDLPYHLLQKVSILLFGFTTFAIKLPSILLASALSFLLILLLNRWFKNNIALLASILTVLSIPFLYLSGTGTPNIMVVFWPTLLLWLGSKIQGEEKPRPSYCFLFAFTMLLSIFTPHMIYLDAFIIFFVLINPHLRFTIKNLPKLPLVLTSLIIFLGLGMLVLNILSNPTIALRLFFAENLDFPHYLNNISLSFAPFFSWGTNPEGVLLTPLIGLPSLFLAFTGLFSTVKGFFASRNSIATYLLIFTIFVSGFDTNSSLLIILPLSILIAHGLRYILEKWYGIFPENPYARIFGILPISIFIIIMIFSGLAHFIFGYRYTPSVANEFNNDLELVSALSEDTTLLLNEDSLEYRFYYAYEDRTHAIDLAVLPPETITGTLATLGKYNFEDYSLEFKGKLDRIITSPKSNNSDRIYLYTAKSE